jgi:hypothetical protein
MTSNIFTSAIRSIVFFVDAVQSVVFSAQIIQSIVFFVLKSNSQSMLISNAHSINSFAISIQNLLISRTTSFASASVVFFDDSFLSSLMISKITSFYFFNLLQKNMKTDETICWKWTFRDFRNSLKINNFEKLHYKRKNQANASHQEWKELWNVCEMKTTKNETKYKVDFFYCFCKIEIIKRNMYSSVDINMKYQWRAIRRFMKIR